MSNNFHFHQNQEYSHNFPVTSPSDSSQFTSSLEGVEWAEILPGKVVVASENCVWLYKPTSSQDQFFQPMKGAGNVAATEKLLDAAIATAKITVETDSPTFELTEIRWVWRLASQYCLTHTVPQLMEKAAHKFAASGNSKLARWALCTAEEERGHDRLALMDIRAMGYDPQAVVDTLAHPIALALVDYLRRSVRDENPIDSVGYSYTMERLANGVDKNYIQRVEAKLPANINATRFLRVHSSIGEDAEHVHEKAAMIANLTAKERIRIARACYETALLCFSSPSYESCVSNEDLQEMLEPLKL